jgi:hypothetical protein
MLLEVLCEINVKLMTNAVVVNNNEFVCLKYFPETGTGVIPGRRLRAARRAKQHQECREEQAGMNTHCVSH